MKTNWSVLAATRFVLASIVVACHLSQILTQNAVIIAVSRFSGLAAVAGFLLISGFSISASIHSRPQGYMSRRIDRIWPVYLVSLIISIGLIVVCGGFIVWPAGLIEAPSTFDLIANATMLPLLFAGKGLAVNAVLWSLIVEEVFYLCSPLLVKASRRVIWCIIGASWLFCAVAPRLGFGYYSDGMLLWAVLALAWLWLLGWQLQTGDNEKTRTAIIVLSCAGVSLSPWGNTLAIVTVGATAAVLIHNGSIKVPERIAGVLTWSGNISYPLYLLHYPTMLAVWHFTESLNPLLYIGAILVVSIAVHHGVELPFRRYRKWQQSRKPVAVPLLRERVQVGNLAA